MLHFIDAQEDVWLIYEYLYAPCQSLIKGITIEPTVHKFYYRNLEEAMYIFSKEKTYRDVEIDVIEHNSFFQVLRS